LKGAIGPCGLTFHNNSLEGLAAVLRLLLTHPEQLDGFRRAAGAHLANFRRDVAARRYLEVLEKAAAGRARK
jgi:glycosyltransferase involved in cell wall biosynthesis